MDVDISGQEPEYDLLTWVRETFRLHGLPEPGSIQLVHDWALSKVYRVSTPEVDLYLKQVPPVFAAEPAITRALWQLFPGNVPEPFVIDARHGRMLMRDMGGELIDFGQISDLEAVVSQLLQMQTTAMQHTDVLLQAGCMDRRPETMPAALAELLTCASRLKLFGAEEQAALEGVAPQLSDMCGELARGGIPSTLVHGDLHFWNVRKRGDQIVVFDWTDASISDPFFDLSVLLRAKLPEQTAPYRGRLIHLYLEGWRQECSDVDRVAALSEPLGALFQLLSYRRLVEAVAEHPDSEGLRRMTNFWVRETVRLMTRTG